MFYEFDGFVPVVHPDAFVHPQAVVTGNVVIGRDCYVGPCAVLRGDWGGIELHEGCNVQENCTIHMFPGITVVLEAAAHVGHGAIIHGAHLGKNVLIGMNAVIMDRVRIGDESIIGALSFVPAEMQIPARSLVVGSPAKIIKTVTDEMLAWKTEGTRLYQQLPADCRSSLRPCQPLSEQTEAQALRRQENRYSTWAETKGG